MIYHIEPVTTTLGRRIPELYQVHTQKTACDKWTFRAIVHLTQKVEDVVVTVTGFLTMKEKTLVLCKALPTNRVSIEENDT